MTIEKIRQKADEYCESAVELLCRLISRKSVLSEAKEGMPYGEGCAECLELAQETLESCGFAVKNFANHAVTASFDERPAELGILCHLDVVPTEGQEWSSDPFDAQIRNGRIYGRGAIDDKGPAAAVITAMKIIKDSGIRLSKNVRLILGSNEENGSSDMEYYRTCEEFPPMLFTPDGSFPIINIEKGMIRYDMKCKCGSSDGFGGRIVRISGGTVYNAVPESCCTIVTGYDYDYIKNVCQCCESLNGIIFFVDKLYDNTICIKAKGKGAHASTPEEGCNAVTAMLSCLSRLDFPDSEKQLKNTIAALAKAFPCGETDGLSAGMKMSDEKSGKLTVVPSKITYEDQSLSIGFDCRFPICADTSKIEELFKKASKMCGCEGSVVLSSEPHYADENSEMIRTLLSVYEECTGEKGSCIAIGGGTYVHDTENGIAFGAEWSDENNMHGADEFIDIDELKKDIVIYTRAILALCE